MHLTSYEAFDSKNSQTEDIKQADQRNGIGRFAYNLYHLFVACWFRRNRKILNFLHKNGSQLRPIGTGILSNGSEENEKCSYHFDLAEAIR